MNIGDGIVKKANNLIRSPFLKKMPDGTSVSGETNIIKNDYSNLTEKEYDLIDALLEIVQTSYKANPKTLLDFIPESENGGRVYTFSLAQLKKLIGIKNRGNVRIEDVIEGLTNRPIKLKQKLYVQSSTHQEKKMLDITDNTTLISQSTFIGETTFDEKGGVKTYKSVEIHFTKLFMCLAHQDVYLPSGYTNINRQYTINIRGKVGKALYQFILSWCHSLKIGEQRTIVLSHEDLIVICGKQPAFAHYKRKLLDAIPKIELFDIVLPLDGYKQDTSIELIVKRQEEKISL